MRALDPLLQSSCNRMLLIGFLILGVHLGTLYQCFKQNLAVAIAFYFSSECLQFLGVGAIGFRFSEPWIARAQV